MTPAEKVAKRFLERTAAEEDDEFDGALTKSDLAGMPPERRAAWKGYRWTLVTESFTPEEVRDDQNEAVDTKQEKGEVLTLDEIVQHCATKDRWEKWSDEWIFGKGKKDRKGGLTRHALSVERVDGRPFNEDEESFLEMRLKVRR